MLTKLAKKILTKHRQSHVDRVSEILRDVPGFKLSNQRRERRKELAERIVDRIFQ